MSNDQGPKTPQKEPESPAKFVKPADLFKMRRRTSTNGASANSDHDAKRRCSPLVAQMRSSPLGFGSSSMVNQYVPSSSKITNSAFHIEPQSPLKCLNNMTDPSPTKNLPIILKNPFNRPVKRRLNLGSSPRKGDPKLRSPTKRTKMLELDEDANLEPPRMKHVLSPRKRGMSDICIQNSWSLRTKLRVNFETQCKNWNGTCASTHKRLSASCVEESPSKLNDDTISIEAIKNASIVYQHPYLAWLSLYPRDNAGFDKKKENPFKLMHNTEVTKMMHKAWCESLNDITNLLIHGHCPYFYLCADDYNILFKKAPTPDPKRPLIQAYISPFSCGMGCELNKFEIEFKCPDLSGGGISATTLATSVKENSQASFGSSQSATTLDIDDEITQDAKQTGKIKATTSIDSGVCSDLCEEDDFGEDENEDASQFLESLGISQQECPTLNSKRKGYTETDSNTQTKSTSNKPLAVTEGKANILKLINFLQTTRLYTTSQVGKFACIPPTILSPTEFRLSTPQYPEVVLSKNMIEITSPDEARQKCFETPKKIYTTNEASGPTFLELKGTILPKIHHELHKLLNISGNKSHTCSSIMLNSTAPFKSVQYSL